MKRAVVLLLTIVALFTLEARSKTQHEIDNNCYCVFFYQCDENGNIITDGRSLFDVRGGFDDHEFSANCSDTSTENCCKLPLEGTSSEPIVDPTDPTPIDPVTTIPNKQTDAPVTKSCDCGEDFPSVYVRSLPDQDSEISVPGEFPWLMEIFEKRYGEYMFKCTGSLIRDNVVLTANHCVISGAASDYLVVAGNDTIFRKPGYKQYKERQVLKKIRHPKYYSGGLYNDVALLLLSTPFELEKETQINTVCLPKSGEKVDAGHCLLAGWGLHNPSLGQHGEGRFLKKLNVDMIERAECEANLRKTRQLGDAFKLHESFVCAEGRAGKDACDGDGGTPLVCQVGSRYVQVGIVSWGIKCGVKGVPGLYANVALFADWIEDTISENQ